MGLSLHFVCLFVDFFLFSFIFFINVFCAYFLFTNFVIASVFFVCAMCSFQNFVYCSLHLNHQVPFVHLETRLRESLYKILSGDKCVRMIHGKHNTTLLISYFAVQKESDRHILECTSRGIRFL